MNSNGIREWLAQAGRSNYRTPRISWWTWLSIGIVIGMLVGSPAHAARGQCLSLSEARDVYHGKHLHWRGDHCWSDLRGVRHVASRHRKIHSSGGGVESRHAETERHPLGRKTVSEGTPTAGVASGPPETKTEAVPSASMIEAAAAALGPPATVLPIHVEAIFADRWQEIPPAISPLRWSRELVEFGSAAP